MSKERKKSLRVGIDVGSTTTKIAIVEDGELGYHKYVRHYARQRESILMLLKEAEDKLSSGELRLCMTGSGSRALADKLGVPFTQEVVANSLALKRSYGHIGTAIELGGQDAKIIFFKDDEHGEPQVFDMRMNGSCAGGTGAFIDEVATVLNVPATKLNAMAEAGSSVYDISGRCGVFAKTDIQALLNQGVKKEDIALSSYHAIAKQTIGGLSQGLDIKAPVAFEGGPLSFHPRLARVFSERLALKDEDIITPKHPELMVAWGAALSIEDLHSAAQPVDIHALIEQLESLSDSDIEQSEKGQRYFENEAEKEAFLKRHKRPASPSYSPKKGERVSAYLGIDSGSTTTKLVLMREDGELIDSFYASNKGNPLDVAKEALLQIYEKYESAGAKLTILAAASTGYGEILFNKAFRTEAHLVETVAHAMAASRYAAVRKATQEERISNIDDPSVNTVAPGEASHSEPASGSRAASVLEAGGVWSRRGQYRKATREENEPGKTKAARGEDASNSRAASVLETGGVSSRRGQYRKATREDNAPGGPSFILDIGGQDMKAIWLEDGIITNIVVNEACSSGCGSFLENFAHTLNIRTEEIAEAAFRSDAPAKLGSRCTVFMNSSIITEQRNGSAPDDIMAGLCRSIIENVFTKVIRVPNIDSLGNHIVVQGGTFCNDAVLRAMEQYAGKEVVRAPYPGLMGAIGCALAAQEAAAEPGFKPSFLSYEELKSFSYSQQANSPCPYCTNHCRRTIVEFSTGGSWVTNNRCERGEVLGDPKDKEVQRKVRELVKQADKADNLYEVRRRLQNMEYPCEPLLEERGITIGIPRVLNFWEGMPFWSTFWRALGFGIEFSPVSTRAIYESGIHAVPSDTECFPAKLVHGHIRELVKQGVDRIFMPEIVVMPSENKEPTSFSRCALVKGYPIVIKNSDNPEAKYGIPFDSPYFYWYTDEDREKQLCDYMYEQYDIARDITKQAVEMASNAQSSYDKELKAAGQAVLDKVNKEGSFAVVLAGRPYHNDPLVNHELPELLLSMGVPVLTADSLPDIRDVDLRPSRIDIVNNFHARMLGSSILAAQSENLEYIQIVSFGCGHDAVLSDEIVRMMKEISGKAPLILKVDESDAQGPLRIRVRSFIETIRRKRRLGIKKEVKALPDPYPVKFTKKERKEQIVLVPNSSHAFCRIMTSAFRSQNIKTVPLDVGRSEAIRLGKRYTHNDICFPAQIVIGEILEALNSGKYDTHNTSVAMAKYLGCCRLPHYATILRKSLDDAGYDYVPIMTNDDVDLHDMHPGFKINMTSLLRISTCLPMIDALEELLHKIRPYEKVKGSADAAFEKAMDQLCEGLEKHGTPGAIRGFKKAMKTLCSVEYDRTKQKPTVLIVGEYLLNFHPGANGEIERYLEDNGFEIIEARMTDVIQKSYFCQGKQITEFKVHRDSATRFWSAVANKFFAFAHWVTDRVAKDFELHEEAVLMDKLSVDSDPVIHHTFDTGEGILIPAEIIHHAKHGCKNFVILQPFGCLPNHVIGRGVCKKLKEMFPDIELLPLDYDPDVSRANIENRLQMMIMNGKVA